MIDARCPCDVCKAGRAAVSLYRHRAARAWPRGWGAGIGAYRVKGAK